MLVIRLTILPISVVNRTAMNMMNTMAISVPRIVTKFLPNE